MVLFLFRSLSFVLFTSGISYLIFSIIFYVVEIRKVWDSYELETLGLNSITIYFCHEVFGDYFPLSFSNRENHEIKIVSNFIGIISMYILAFWMRKNKIFLKV